MKFDIDKVLADMVSAITGTVDSNRDKVGTLAAQFLQNDKDRLEMLAQLRLSGDLTNDKFLQRLADEKLVVEAELNALAVVSKAIAQQAANAAIAVLEKAVMLAI